MAGILDGIKVVELASWTFVPAAGAVLADWGADVIKVEDTKAGDPGRALVVGGLRRQNARADADFMLEIGNRGKRSIGLDLKSEKGHEYLAKLLAEADVFLTNWLPAPLERANLTFEQVRAINPNIIVARGSGQGPLGPDRNRGGFDSASFMARGGVAYALTPDDSEYPLGQGPAFGDLPSGMTLAGGVIGALYHREKTGETTTVDVSLLAQAMWTMAPDILASDFFGVDRIPVPPVGSAINPVTNKYKTLDGRWLQLVFLQPDKFWANFCHRVGLSELAEDGRFVPSANLMANTDEATAILREHFASRDLEHWTKVLADEPGVWSAIASPQEVLVDPQAASNGYLIENKDDNGVDYRVVAPPVQYGNKTPEPSRAPEHGQHTEEILLELGLSWADIAEAKDCGAVL